jgi:hypothetical protein
MLARKDYPRVYIETAQDAFDVQLAQLEKAELAPALQRNALRNLALSLEMHFVHRQRGLEPNNGALKELRSVAELLMHDAKAPVALEYLRNLASESFDELFEVFAN